MSKPLATKVSTSLSENVQIGPISHFLSPVSCDSLVLQGLMCEWRAGVKFGVITLTLSYWALEVQNGTSWQRILRI